MTDALAPWANLGMLTVIGGIVTLVLAAVAGASSGGDVRADAPTGRLPVPQLVGALGAVTAFVAGLAVAAVAAVAPDRWWFTLLGWGVWIGGEILVFALVAVLARYRHRAAP